MWEREKRVKQASAARMVGMRMYAVRERDLLDKFRDWELHVCAINSRSDDGIPRETRTVSLYLASTASIGRVLCCGATFSCPSRLGLYNVQSWNCLDFLSFVNFWKRCNASSRVLVVVVNDSHQVVHRMKTSSVAVRKTISEGSLPMPPRRSPRAASAPASWCSESCRI